MQLTQYTDYALRALIYIAASKTSCTISDIADAYGIKKNHLTKIINHLAQLKFIHTTRGKNGGITLAIQPEKLNLKKAILLLEPHFDLVPCFNQEKQNCCIASACKLKHMLIKAQQAFLNVLADYTLADILVNQSTLRGLLNIDN